MKKKRRRYTLENLYIDRVDHTDIGANQHADIVFYKGLTRREFLQTIIGKSVSGHSPSSPSQRRASPLEKDLHPEGHIPGKKKKKRRRRRPNRTPTERQAMVNEVEKAHIRLDIDTEDKTLAPQPGQAQQPDGPQPDFVSRVAERVGQRADLPGAKRPKPVKAKAEKGNDRDKRVVANAERRRKEKPKARK